ncbi:ubiquitin carboxyl-terminal hydrolase family protein [Endozoicomonas ascidiicola]|uniref:ubiquitin carboxyl-terminal hydrolase family protein n=1 Tax=Endozoicomonas ascidiicola TaxID=1698521 RepID=UPI00082CE2E0|nr:ubiquitin carboxyl-terminal hydrolase family protein [Endozoicomonas ascidiicola]
MLSNLNQHPILQDIIVMELKAQQYENGNKKAGLFRGRVIVGDPNSDPTFATYAHDLKEYFNKNHSLSYDTNCTINQNIMTFMPEQKETQTPIQNPTYSTTSPIDQYVSLTDMKEAKINEIMAHALSLPEEEKPEFALTYEEYKALADANPNHVLSIEFYQHNIYPTLISLKLGYEKLFSSAFSSTNNNQPTDDLTFESDEDIQSLLFTPPVPLPKPVGPQLPNRDSKCWLNSALNFLILKLETNTIPMIPDIAGDTVIKNQALTSLVPLLNAALKNFQTQYRAIAEEILPSDSLEEDQLDIINYFKSIATNCPEGSSLEKLFPRENSSMQQDASEFLTTLFELNKMNSNKEFSLIKKTVCTAEYQGRPLRKITGTSDHFALMPLVTPHHLPNQTDVPFTMNDYIKKSREGLAEVRWARSEHGLETDDLTIPTQQSEEWSGQLDHLKSISFSLGLFDYDIDKQQRIKCADIAQKLFANPSLDITFRATNNSDGLQYNIHGQLTSLICHQGESPFSGHYITLSCESDGSVIVRDDEVVCKLSDYVTYKQQQQGIELSDCIIINSVYEFLINFGFAPYIADYKIVDKTPA